MITFGMRSMVRLTATALVTACMVMLPGLAKADKYRIFYSASYYGNEWQAQAINMMNAMASHPKYRDKVEFSVQVAGANAQRQIQQINAMIAAGAHGIIVYPISPTALNAVARRACDQGIVVFAFDSEITEPCTYIAKIDVVEKGRSFARWMANELGGKGNIVHITGVAGTTYNDEIIEGVMEVLAEHPDIRIIAEVDGEWSHAVARVRLTEVLATRSWDEIDGLIVQTGCGVANTMQLDAGVPPEELRPCAGETSNGGRIQMLPPGTIDGAVGARRYSSGSAPWGGAYALKQIVSKLDGEDIGPRHHELDPQRIVTGEAILCQEGTTEELRAGCNTFHPDLMPATYFTDFWDPLVEELDLQSTLVGTPALPLEE